MAAFTKFSEEALARYITMFDRGVLAGFEPVIGGIENSNYFVTLDNQGSISQWVLTILEGLSFDETGFFSKLLSHLYHYGLPVAAPAATLDGMTATSFCGKPAFLFPRLSGSHVTEPEEYHCEQIGHFLARSHQSLGEISIERANPYPVKWMRETLAAQGHRLPVGERNELDTLITEYEELQARDLPRGLIHGDLFHDNALFEDGQLSGVIDFYHACSDLLLQDLAIVINDWCAGPDGDIEETRKRAVLRGYASVRELTGDEQEALQPMQRASAARFALTRLLSGDPPLKDPGQMLALARNI